MEQRITVSVDDEHFEQVDGVAETLKAAGMNVEQVLGSVGIITGSVESERRADIERLPGVGSVEEENTFQIPPPDADIQ
jgi:hypothetical protein